MLLDNLRATLSTRGRVKTKLVLASGGLLLRKAPGAIMHPARFLPRPGARAPRMTVTDKNGKGGY